MINPHIQGNPARKYKVSTYSASVMLEDGTVQIDTVHRVLALDRAGYFPDRYTAILPCPISFLVASEAEAWIVEQRRIDKAARVQR